MSTAAAETTCRSKIRDEAAAGRSAAPQVQRRRVTAGWVEPPRRRVARRRRQPPVPRRPAGRARRQRQAPEGLAVAAAVDAGHNAQPRYAADRLRAREVGHGWAAD